MNWREIVRQAGQADAHLAGHKQASLGRTDERANECQAGRVVEQLIDLEPELFSCPWARAGPFGLEPSEPSGRLMAFGR